MVERKLSWLNGFQQLMMCFERGGDIHQTIIGHGGALIAGITLSGFDSAESTPLVHQPTRTTANKRGELRRKTHCFAGVTEHRRTAAV
jgi:hypothetical protein